MPRSRKEAKREPGVIGKVPMKGASAKLDGMPPTPGRDHITAADAARRLLALKAASESFEAFVEFMKPQWTLAPFQRRLIQTLDKLERGELHHEDGHTVRNLLVTMPPRFAKSTFCTVLFPSYFMAKDASRFLMSCSYNSQLATDFGREVRAVVEHPDMARIFPEFHLSKESRAADVWRTTEMGAYYAVGVGGTTSGRAANCFSAGTRVVTPYGVQNIENLTPGDKVVAYDFEAGKPVVSEVVACQSRLARTVERRGVRATPDHPVFDVARGEYRNHADGDIQVFSLFEALRGQALTEAQFLFEEVLPGHNEGGGDAQLRVLLGAVLRAEDRNGQGGQEEKVLLSRLRNKVPDASSYERMRAVWHAFQRQAAYEDQALLQDLRVKNHRGKAQDTGASLLPRMRDRLSSALQRLTVLLHWLQERLALQIHAGRLQPALLARGGQLAIPPGLAADCAASPRAGLAYLRGLRGYSSEFGRASHQHGQGGQSPGEPRLDVQELPHHPAQDTRSGPVEDFRLERVYDIEVASCHNFFVVPANADSADDAFLVHNCLIVDDPIKSRDDAESMTQRNSTWNYYTSALSTRLQPDNHDNPPIQIIVLTRWHPDDLAGRLQKTEDWKEGRWAHINFQAITRARGPSVARNTLPPDHPAYHPGPLKKLTPRERYVYTDVEKSLWPKRFPLEDLKRRQRLNPREFASLYQQEPYIVGGNKFKTDWWRYYPADLKPENFASLVIAVDTAFKKTEDADYSAILVAGVDRGGDIYVVDVMRGKWEYPELKYRLVQLNNQWRGKGLRAFYVEDKASGMSIIQELKRTSGVSVIPHKVVNDKVARATAILPLIEGGRVFLPEAAPWLDHFIEETVTFPGGTHDDVVDALVIALDVLSRTAVGAGDWDLAHDISQSLNQQHDPFGQFGKSLSQTLKRTKDQTWRGWGM